MLLLMMMVCVIVYDDRSACYRHHTNRRVAISCRRSRRSNRLICQVRLREQNCESTIFHTQMYRKLYRKQR